MTATATKSVSVTADEYTQIANSESETQQHALSIFPAPQDMLRVVVGGEDVPDPDTDEHIALVGGEALTIKGHEREMRSPDHAPHLPNIWVRAEYKETYVIYTVGDAIVMRVT